MLLIYLCLWLLFFDSWDSWINWIHSAIIFNITISCTIYYRLCDWQNVNLIYMFRAIWTSVSRLFKGRMYPLLICCLFCSGHCCKYSAIWQYTTLFQDEFPLLYVARLVYRAFLLHFSFLFVGVMFFFQI